MDALFTPSFILQLIIAITVAAATGVGIYGAIKGDLIRAMNMAENALGAADRAQSAAERAHVRVDEMLQVKRG